MDRRYEQFNEVTFEAYVKSAIDKSVKKAQKRQADRGQWEQSFSTLTDAILYSISQENTDIKQVEQIDQVGRSFRVRGASVLVNTEKLGQALSFLPSKDREIVLMYYFQKMRDEKIARALGISRATVQRRRNNAIKKLHTFLEDNE